MGRVVICNSLFVLVLLLFKFHGPFVMSFCVVHAHTHIFIFFCFLSLAWNSLVFFLYDKKLVLDLWLKFALAFLNIRKKWMFSPFRLITCLLAFFFLGSPVPYSWVKFCGTSYHVFHWLLRNCALIHQMLPVFSFELHCLCWQARCCSSE